ncbi:SixA phosphatase family protein [Streptomyces anulatus]|uniref:SixA phosphatase family protein n=1 Tax=Streptomyces anulatus TaxID=1892 RepID=UPI0038685005|nr:histidine phosphatase family protein [Streptomyces anulatus]
MTTEKARKIVLARHGKAEWNDDDRARPLAERGRKEAPVAGRWLAGSGVAPDLALVSTAVRARESWRLMGHELSAQPKTVFEDRVYEASVGELLALVNETADDVNELLVLGHTPGIFALADALSDESEGDLVARMNRSGFPHSAVAVLSFNGEWKSVETGAARLSAYWSPKD